MALPVAAAMSIGSRLAAFITSQLATKPAQVATLASRLKTAGAPVLKSASDIAAYAKSNPVNAALVAGTVAQLGYTLTDIVGSDDQAVNSALQNLQMKAGQGRRGNPVYDAIADESTSAALSIPVEDIQALQAASRNAVRWAISHFGGREQAMDALSKLEYLAAMPSVTRNFLIDSTR